MRAIVCCALIAAAASLASAANFSGTWTLPGGRGGRGGSVLTLNQAGGKVSGTISIRIDRGTNAPVYAGLWDCKVEGDTLSFYVWTGNDQFTKAIYRGVLSPSGDEIVFTVTRDPETGSAPAATPAGAAQSGRTGPAASQQITARRTL